MSGKYEVKILRTFPDVTHMKRFTNHSEPWGEFWDVKYWQGIKNPKKYCGKELFFGSVTDPYNPGEEIYKRTRTLLKQLQGSGVKLNIQTKSALVLRYIDLIKTFPDARVGFSINTLDENFKGDVDQAASIERRFEAIKKLHDTGIRTTCFISPLFQRAITLFHSFGFCITGLPKIFPFALQFQYLHAVFVEYFLFLI